MVYYEVGRVRRYQRLKIDFDKELVEGDVELKRANLIRLLFGSILGGLCGAMGLAGGVVINPLLLTLGVPTQVVTATGMYLMLYSQASNTIIYLLMGYLPLNFAVWIGLCSCIGIIVCLITINEVIKRTGRQSVVLAILTVLLLASAIMIPIFSIPKI